MLTAQIAANVRAQDATGIRNGELPGETQAHTSRVTIDGGAMAAKVVAVVLPEYPRALQDAHVGGTVVLSAVIARDGSVKQLTVASGPAELQRAATEAVRRWRYQPTLIEGRPVEVSTTISVEFTPGRTPRYEQQGANVPSTAAAMDPQLRADILHLIEVTHLRKTMREYGQQMMETMRPSIMDSLPETADRQKIMSEVEKKMMAALQSEAATDQIIVVYAKYLSDDDVKGAAAFYESPAGQRFNSVSAQMEDDLSQSGEQFALENLDLILKGLCASHPELRGKADFCQKDQSRQHGALRLPSAPAGQREVAAARGN